MQHRFEPPAQPGAAGSSMQKLRSISSDALPTTYLDGSAYSSADRVTAPLSGAWPNFSAFLLMQQQWPALLLALATSLRTFVSTLHTARFIQQCYLANMCADDDDWRPGTSSAAAVAPADVDETPAEASAPAGPGGTRGLISKRMRRVLANRASAARSKDRKRAIEELETQAGASDAPCEKLNLE